MSLLALRRRENLLSLQTSKNETFEISDVRRELLDGESNPDLIYAMYGLLMLLPQSASYRMLKDRLTCIHIPNIVQQQDQKR